MEHKQEIGDYLSESADEFDLRGHLVKKPALRHFRFTIKITKSPITQKRNEFGRKLLLITYSKSMIAFQNPG